MKRKADMESYGTLPKYYAAAHNQFGGYVTENRSIPGRDNNQQPGDGQEMMVTDQYELSHLPQLVDYNAVQDNPARNPTFYFPPNGKLLNKCIWIRKYFNENTQMFEVHWMRENLDSQNVPYCLPSRQFVSAYELEEFILKFRKIFEEIRLLRSQDTPPRFLYNPAAANAKEWTPQFWADGICETIGSNILRMRPARTPTGIHLIKIIRMYQEPVMRQGKTSMGVKIAMDRKTAAEFIQELIRLRKEIDDEEIARITASTAC